MPAIAIYSPFSTAQIKNEPNVIKASGGKSKNTPYVTRDRPTTSVIVE
jgi:hypothetical protein